MVGTHRRYDRFRQKLASTTGTGAAVIAALADLLPPLNASSIAILATPPTAFADAASGVEAYGLLAASSHSRLWHDYAGLCRLNREPLSRVVRLSPHPVALSDIAAHRRLATRTSTLVAHLMRYGMDNIFVVPVMDRQFGLMLVGVAGRGLMLGPANRHLVAQAAAAAVGHLANGSPAAPNGSPRDSEPAHLALSGRQMEIATWLVAGKTDWEIGEILRISPKTVNYHVERMKRTYGVKTRNQFVAAIVHDGRLAPG